MHQKLICKRQNNYKKTKHNIRQMNEFFIYLMQSAFSLGALYLIYWFFLRKDTFFSANRFYLIGSIILSFVLPLFKVPVFYNDPELTYVVVLEAVTITAQKVETGIANNLNFYQSAFIVYITGAAIFFIRFVFQLLQLVFLIRKFGVTKIDGLKVVKLDRKYSPFSYFNYVFLNEESLNDKNIKEIIDHEKIHINQKHSIDLVLLEFLTIIQWFNPFIWFYKMAIKGIHEYLADAGLIANGLNKTSYQHLLLSHSIGIQINNLTNNFNQSLIKKRFIMMTKNQSKKFARLKFLLAIPIAAILIASFAFTLDKQNASQSPSGISDIADEEASIIVDQDPIKKDHVFAVVEKMPEFPGGKNALMRYLGSNIKYPEAARKAGVQGMVHVTYIVEKDGTISELKINRGIGEGCDEEALRVISMMPKWKPGSQRGEPVRVQFNLPIKFVLDGDGASKNNETTVFAYRVVDGTPQLADKHVFAVVDEMPEYPGGQDEMMKYLGNNIKYPDEARKAGIQGLVYVTYVVEKDGTITELRINRGIGGGCDEEAIRVVSAMPKWEPGKQNGKPVRVQFNLPIKFSLQ